MANEQTIEQYRGMLRVSKHHLDDELEIQAEIQDRISQQVTRANTRAIDAKEELAKVEARLTIQLREERDKLTVDMLNAAVRRHADRVRAFDDWQNRRAALEEWQGLLEAWKQRGFSLKGLGELHGDQYFAVNSTTRSERSRRRDDAVDGDARSALRQAQPSVTPRRRVD